MKTNREIKRDEVAAYAYELYKKALAEGMSNQEAIDKARQHKKVRVCDRTMRNYLALMEERVCA